MVDQNDKSWCSFDATEPISAIISNIALLAITLVFALLLVAYCKHRNIGTFKSSTEKVSFIFELIFLWAFCIALAEIVNIIAYYVYIND